MPPAANMDAIREALMRRRAGGGGTPAMQQISQPTSMTPGGTPGQPLPTPPPVMPGGAIPQMQGQPAPRQNQPADVDPQTRDMTKALIARLIKYI